MVTGKLHVVNHPLLKHKLGYLRDKTTGSSGFRELMKEISRILAHEVMRDWTDMREVVVETPIAQTKVERISNAPVVVSVLRAGNGMLDAVLQPTGYSSAFATDGGKALVRYKNEKFDLVLADIDMKPMDGITLLRQLKLYDPAAVVIIMTAYASTESAVQAVKYGAFDYLQKPFRVDELIATMRRGLEFRKFQAERAAAGLAPGVKSADIESRLIGKSAKLTKLIAQVKKLATVRTPVLLIGENGTGKELTHIASFSMLVCALSLAHFHLHGQG